MEGRAEGVLKYAAQGDRKRARGLARRTERKGLGTEDREALSHTSSQSSRSRASRGQRKGSIRRDSNNRDCLRTHEDKNPHIWKLNKFQEA